MAVRSRLAAGALALVAGALLAGCGGGGGGERSLPDPPAQGNVRDDAGILSDQEEQRLSDLIDRRNGETDAARVAVLTVDGVEGDWEDWTRDVANSWPLGEGETSNGVLLAVDMDGRDLRIEVGDDAREAITDDDAEQIVEDVLEPPFRDGDYDRGLTDTVDALYDEAEGVRPASDSGGGNGGLVAAVIFGAVGLIVVAVLIWVFADARKWRRVADEEIEEYLRENPGKEVSEPTRKAFRKYRYHHRKPPKDQEEREERRRRAERGEEELADADDPQRYTQYAPGFGTWLPLYVAAPALYTGSGTAPPGSDGAGSSGSSFGGTPGGFSGGGASGSF